jgi:hypothetical protein
VAYIPFWMTYKRNLARLPTYEIASQNYSYFRIPRPPIEDPAGSTPGLICWGAAGSINAQAEPLPTVDFNVKNETSRKSENVRIQNPDDPSQYVIADRPTEITFQGINNKTANAANTASVPAPGRSDFGSASEKFVTVGGGAQSTGTETFKYATAPPS